MMPDHREQLRSIRDFPALVEYLHDELDWPVGDTDFEDLTYEYTAEELGIDEASAAKIQEIKRLRPLAAGQPWGIFFVSFEPKRLPVVALRRILGSVAIKKRAAGDSAERVAWSADDLLFISAFGEGSQRQISFAHFAVDEEKHDLPTLKILGWDDRDTLLHIDAAMQTLKRCLSWPDDTSDTDAWRRRWRSAFVLGHKEVISTSRGLALRLASLARSIRERILRVLSIEAENGPTRRLMRVFKEALIHDLDEDGFADMYAQTIAYGLLSARVSHPSNDTAGHLASVMPATTPFLKELMETFLTTGGRKSYGLDFDELGISEVVELLDAANMEAVLRDFGDSNPEEDPVIHFYELFLREYDADKRMQRGVFYTPKPVVSFIVRSVDGLLRTEFGLEDGLADTSTWAEVRDRVEGIEIPVSVDPQSPFVSILDPATGTGTFLVEVVESIHSTLAQKWREEGASEEDIIERWNDYVPSHLLPRLFGYELLMAPYAIAHLKVGLKLRETGYRFDRPGRTRIYLTNSLEPETGAGQQVLETMLPALAHEAQAVNEVKAGHHFTVVLGNPPYSRSSTNRSTWILSLISEYKDGLRERKLNLDDDYIKFIRLAHEQVRRSGAGVLGYVTNNSYLDGLVHRRMRERLMADYSSLCLLDLHGSTVRRETTPEGGKDENIFDIQQGVSVILAARAPLGSGASTVMHADLWGTRQDKYLALSDPFAIRNGMIALSPEEPNWFFEPKDSAHDGAEYEAWPSVKALFRVKDTGIQTKKDGLTVGFSRDEVYARVREFAELSEDEARQRFNLGDDSAGWSVSKAQTSLRRNGVHPENVRPIQYRPFDYRWIYYGTDSGGIIGRPRFETMRHLLAGENIALIATRQFAAHRHFVAFCTPVIADMSSQPYASYVLHPLYIDQEPDSLLAQHSRVPNLDTRALCALEGSPEMAADRAFDYIYAVLYSPTYRERYASQLAIDFPHIPAPLDGRLFSELQVIGRRLVDLHAMRVTELTCAPPRFQSGGDTEVRNIGWRDDVVWIDAPKTRAGYALAEGSAGFVGVPEEVWHFTVGGYQICEKWLKDRRGRSLSDADASHYGKVVATLLETLALMKQIDQVIARHGGWPDAFVSRALGIEPKAAEDRGTYDTLTEDPSETLWSEGVQLHGDF